MHSQRQDTNDQGLESSLCSEVVEVVVRADFRHSGTYDMGCFHFVTRNLVQPFYNSPALGHNADYWFL